ncbi:sensor histidine kinase [Cryptosporangium aurantiacum]|uniref:histidine kinase n=1 Tax=Cryptosporangium aurantiacum TaxID=134849 RepID=A0A1M7MYK1_9ACTN|nr:sensor histidine kinase [Cryptosporangium aurantiacum]SHM95731.1 Signal transduction histidine kinase [Cryptosporangium aurantiacum]
MDDRRSREWGGPHGGFPPGRPDWNPDQDQDRWENRGPSPAAHAVVGILIATLLGTFLVSRTLDGYHPLDARGWVLLIAAPLLLGARRKAPVPVAVLVSLVISAYYLLGYPPGPVFFAQLVALHAVLLATRRWVAWTIAGVGYAAFTVAEQLVGEGPGVPIGGLIAAALWTALVLVGTEAGRAGRERSLEYRARRIEAERSRQEGERRRVSDERLRIAREVHDLLGHHLSLISVQSGVALHLMDARTAEHAVEPVEMTAAEHAELRSALAAIKQSSKDALVELRATVNALRGVDENAPRQPTPTIGRLDELLAGATATGLKVTAEQVGEPRPLPPRVDLAAFRIIQEALTNVRRHAGPVPAVVTLEYGADLLVVRIDDDGPQDEDEASSDVRIDFEQPPEGGGNGIPGMRERAQSVGGTLEAGPRPDGGFRVCAKLPLDGAA